MSVRSILLLCVWACASEPITLDDVDGDGFCPDPGLAWVPDRYLCAGAGGFGDCDDADPARHPGATEACDDLDDDCDGALWEQEVDGDGDGQPPCRGDCDDDDPDRYRLRDERCNEVDDDCDGKVDEGDDLDGDGWAASSCSGEPVDCNDGDAQVHPGAAERCNRRDDNCDRRVDEGVEPPTWYLDVDGDGYGLAGNTQVACEPFDLWTAPEPGDCNDNRDWIHPGAAELCNMLDDDCDGLDDDGWEPLVLRYLDQDGDGFGRASSSSVGCGAAPGYVVAATDCDDTASSVNPSVPEQCNGVDDDCDLAVDEVDAVGCQPFHADVDLDGFGDPARSACQCGPTAAFPAPNADDCDDAASGLHPNAADLPNGLDDDCDGEIDPGAWGLCWVVPDGVAPMSGELSVRGSDGALTERWTGAGWSTAWPVQAEVDGAACAFVRATSDRLLQIEARGWHGAGWVPATSLTACALPSFEGGLTVDGRDVAPLLRPEGWDPLTGAGASWRCGAVAQAWVELPCKGAGCVCDAGGLEVCYDGALWALDACGWLDSVAEPCAGLSCVDELVAPQCTTDALGSYGCTAPLDVGLHAWLLNEGVPSGLYCGVDPCDGTTAGQLDPGAVGPVYWLWTEAAPSLAPAVAQGLLGAGSFTCRRAPDGQPDPLSWDGDCFCAHPAACSSDPADLPPGCPYLLPGDCDDAAPGNHPDASEALDDLYDNDCDGLINEP
jgi:hypothetical protein